MVALYRGAHQPHYGTDDVSQAWRGHQVGALGQSHTRLCDRGCGRRAWANGLCAPCMREEPKVARVRRARQAPLLGPLGPPCARCTRPRRLVSRGLCSWCYETMRRSGHLDRYPDRVGRKHTQHLTEEDVATIRARYAAGGVTQKELAAEYGVNPPWVSRIVNGKGWRARGRTDG